MKLYFHQHSNNTCIISNIAFNAQLCYISVLCDKLNLQWSIRVHQSNALIEQCVLYSNNTAEISSTTVN